MYCNKCGRSVPDGERCPCDGSVKSYVLKDNGKLYSILSYIGILWIIGIFAAPEKDDPSVRFHVGQGMLLSIAAILLRFAMNIVRFALAIPDFVLSLLTEQPTDAILSTVLSAIVSLATIVWAVMGIINAVRGETKPLPLIGRFAFYR